MNHGAKRDYRKIDIFVADGGVWKYVASTTWAKTCKEAKARWFASHHGHHIDAIRTQFSKQP